MSAPTRAAIPRIIVCHARDDADKRQVTTPNFEETFSELSGVVTVTEVASQPPPNRQWLRRLRTELSPIPWVRAVGRRRTG